MTTEFLNTEQLAELLGVATSTIEAWRYSDRGPPYVKLAGGRRGGLVRYARAAVEAWLAAQTRGAAPT